MGKLSTYIIVMSGLMLLFYFTGLTSGTPNSTLLDLLLAPESMPELDEPEGGISKEAILVFEGVAITAAIVVGIVIGNVELALFGAFAVYFFNLGWDFLGVFNAVRAVNPVFAILIFAPILLLYVITMLEWMRGID